MKIQGIDTRTPQKSWQGEGPYNGQRIVILRVMGCNLKCHWPTATGGLAWCDTKWTWDGSEKGAEWDVGRLVASIVSEASKRMPMAKWEKPTFLGAFKKAKIVMVTGGEPMLRQSSESFQALIEGLRANGFAIHFETNGTVLPNEWAKKNVDFFDVSPKYQIYRDKYTREMITAWQKCGVQVAWKFVVGRMNDVFDLRAWLEQMGISKDADIWLMPLTLDDKSMKDAQDILNGGVDEAFRIEEFKHVTISPRLQITGAFP
jgi:7-carboxy-7-deazaguanine synthase